MLSELEAQHLTKDIVSVASMAEQTALIIVGVAGHLGTQTDG